jgi:hypothetical protein
MCVYVCKPWLSHYLTISPFSGTLKLTLLVGHDIPYSMAISTT